MHIIQKTHIGIIFTAISLAKVKANAAQGIPELIQIATNEEFSINQKEKRGIARFLKM